MRFGFIIYLYNSKFLPDFLKTNHRISIAGLFPILLAAICAMSIQPLHGESASSSQGALKSQPPMVSPEPVMPATPVSRVSPEDLTTLTIEQCLNRALEDNPDILTAKQKIESSKGLIITAQARLYPSINLNTQVYQDNSDILRQVDTSTPVQQSFRDDWTTTLALQQNIFSGGYVRNNIAAAKLQNDVDFIALQETINSQIYNVRKAFYDVLLNQSNIALHQQTISLLKKEEERQKKLFEAGRATRFNILRTEVRLANEIPGLTESENNVRTSIITLLDLMGESWPRNATTSLPLRVEGTLDCPEVAYDMEQLIQKALAYSPELTRKDKEIEIAKRHLAMAKATNVPNVNLFSGANIHHQLDVTPDNYFNNQTEATFGVAAVWNVFDGFTGRGEAKQAEADIQTSQIQRSAIVRRIEADVRTAYLSLQQARLAVQSQAGNVQKAFENIGLAQASADAGYGTQFDVLQATVDFSESQNIELKARYDYQLALADLERTLFTRVRTDADLDITQPPVAQPAAPTPIQNPNLQLRQSR